MEEEEKKENSIINYPKIKTQDSKISSKIVSKGSNNQTKLNIVSNSNNILQTKQFSEQPHNLLIPEKILNAKSKQWRQFNTKKFSTQIKKSRLIKMERKIPCLQRFFVK